MANLIHLLDSFLGMCSINNLQDISRISSWFPESGLKQGWGGETSYFLALCFNISSTVGDTSMVTISD